MSNDDYRRRLDQLFEAHGAAAIAALGSSIPNADEARDAYFLWMHTNISRQDAPHVITALLNRGLIERDSSIVLEGSQAGRESMRVTLAGHALWEATGGSDSLVFGRTLGMAEPNELAALDDLGLPVLSTLYRLDSVYGPQERDAVAEHANVSPQETQDVLRRLVDAGLAERVSVSGIVGGGSFYQLTRAGASFGPSLVRTNAAEQRIEQQSVRSNVIDRSRLDELVNWYAVPVMTALATRDIPASGHIRDEYFVWAHTGMSRDDVPHVIAALKARGFVTEDDRVQPPFSVEGRVPLRVTPEGVSRLRESDPYHGINSGRTLAEVNKRDERAALKGNGAVVLAALYLLDSVHGMRDVAEIAALARLGSGETLNLLHGLEGVGFVDVIDSGEGDHFFELTCDGALLGPSAAETVARSLGAQAHHM